MEKHSITNVQSRNTNVALRIYCDLINNSNADIFVVMARKAVCLVKHLFRHGRINEEIYSKCVSSNALMYDLSSFAGKKVAIVDDIIISGSALASTAHQLICAGVKEDDLEIIALVRNKDYQTMQFTRTSDGDNLLKCAMNASDAECIEISYDISHIIVYDGMQYDADYPAFDPMEISKEEISALTSSTEWYLYETTNTMQREGNISAFSLFPKKSALKRFWDAIGVELADIIHVKVRLYFRDYASGKCKVNIVPMACFNEISEDMLNNLFHMLSGLDEIGASHAWSKKARMHFLQYYIAFLLHKHIVESNISKVLKLSEDDLNFNFGRFSSKCIIRYLEKQNTFVNCNSIKGSAITPSLLGYDKSQPYSLLHKNDEFTCKNNNVILIDPIKWWYISKELDARDHLCKLAPHYYHDYQVIDECLKRLKYGFSLCALMKLLRGRENAIPVRHEVSLFLDRAIDEGIIVPVDFYNENQGYYCRAYRHGEDLPFAEADKCRLLFFLQELDKCFRADNNNQVEKIAETTFEKMLVLFYQIGLKKGRMFNRFLGLGNDPILQQRFNVHGIVAAVNEALEHNIKHHVYLSSESDNDGDFTVMITRQLYDYPNNYICKATVNNQSFFSIQPDKINEYLTTSMLNNLSQEIRDDISLIANMIEKWYWLQCEDGFGKREYKNDIAALTSCSDIFAFASSIATEVHYFKRYWEEEARNLLLDLRQGNEVRSFSSSRFSQALPSGRNKHRWFLDGHAHHVMRYVSKIFAEANLHNEERLWRTLWRDEITTEIPGSNKLIEYTNKSLQFLYLYSEVYDWLCSWSDNHGGISRTPKSYYDSYKSVLTKSDPDYYYIFDITEKKRKYTEKINYLIQSIDGIILESEKTVRQIETCLSEKVGTYSVEYHSGFVVEMYASPNVDTDRVWRELWKSIPETGEKTLINIIDLGNSKTQNKMYGVFHTEADWQATEDLLAIFKSFHRLSCRKALKSSAVFIPYFPPMMSFRHNLRSNIKRYVEEFMKEYFKAIEGLIQQQNTHQIAVLAHDDVEPILVEKIERALKEVGYMDLQTNDSTYQGMDIVYRQYGCGELMSADKLINSTVQIKVENELLGTGFLFSYQGDMYCVCSQHLLDNKASNQNLRAMSVVNNFEFNLCPKNLRSNSETGTRVARNDVLVCFIDLSDCADFDGRFIFSEEDCILDASVDVLDHQYTILGFGGETSTFGKRNLRLVSKGRVARGFIEMECCDGRAEPGDSGAAVVSTKNQLLGIHSQSGEPREKMHQRVLICPIETLMAELKSIEKRRK